jgi:nicotinate dehydrogenase subunit B
MKLSAGIPKHVEAALSTDRRGFLKSAGMLVVSFAASANAAVTDDFSQNTKSQSAGPYPDLDFRQLDSWIVIHENNTATFYVGKTDPGQGTGTGFRQLMSDELDIAFEQTACVMGSTDLTVDQGGSGGSSAMERDSWPMRRAAAEARRTLLELASARMGVPVDGLAVNNAVIHAKADSSKKVTYGELIAGKKFNVTLTGANINSVTGLARPKAVSELKYTGQAIQRDDIPAKVDGSQKWVAGVKLPGMVHARNVKPPFAGATLKAVDDSAVRKLPGFVRVLREGNYLAVVCEREEQAIRAARELKVTWEKPARAPFPPSEELFTYIRSATPTSASEPIVTGDPDSAFAASTKVIDVEYEIPFQGHTSFAGALAVADPSNGQMTLYSNDMKSYGMRSGIAAFLKMPRDRVRVTYMQGPQCYGRSAAEDAAFEAAWIARELGRPVRMQWMRHEETAWDTKGPAYLVKMRGGLDTEGRPVAYEFKARCCDYNHVGYNEHDTVLIAQLMGSRRATPARGSYDTPSDMYAVPNRRMSAEIVSLPLVWESPLRTGNLRDPNGPQPTFGSESFIDELAAAANADPLEFRLRMLAANTTDDPGFRRVRSIAVLKAAAEAYGWDPRPSPKPSAKGNLLTGRGVAYSFRGQTVVAQIAEVEVNTVTGHVWAKRITCAHDCGLVVNPESLRRTVEGATMHGLSRALHEEVRFDSEKVTSVDWVSHPTLRHADAPERIDVIFVNGDPNPKRPDLRPYGAGEAALKPMMAAIGNAIFDATGVRIRRVPFRPERVLAALKSATV